MAAEIHKLQKNGVTIYPATTTDAVVDPFFKKNVSKLISQTEGVIEEEISGIVKIKSKNLFNKENISTVRN